MNANEEEKMNPETTVSGLYSPQWWGMYTRLLVNGLTLETKVMACGRFPA